MSASLSSREKVLSILVGGIAFILVTFFVTDYFLKSKARLTTDLGLKMRVLKKVQGLGAEKALYEQREAWLREKQPKLVNEDRVGGELLEQVQKLMKNHQIVPENPVVRATLRKPEWPYVSVGVEFETKSEWPALIAFLGELQTPEQFIAFDSLNLKIDSAEPTKMRGKFKIARWYAPAK